MVWKTRRMTALKHSKSSSAKTIPILYHGTQRKYIDSIMKDGIRTTEGRGGAGTSGVYLSATPQGALYWAKDNFVMDHPEIKEISRLDRHYTSEELEEMFVVLKVKIPANKTSFLKADMEQAEDVGFEGSDKDWESSLEQIGDVVFEEKIPSAWIEVTNVPHR